MRKLKFRVWNKEEKSWVPQNVVDSEWPIGFLEDPSSEYEVCQFTGLYDRDGKEIYEGDILGYGDNYPCLAEWDQFSCVVMAVEYGDDKTYPRYHDLVGYKTCPWKKLGNKFEHKELLG